MQSYYFLQNTSSTLVILKKSKQMPRSFAHLNTQDKCNRKVIITSVFVCVELLLPRSWIYSFNMLLARQAKILWFSVGCNNCMSIFQTDLESCLKSCSQWTLVKLSFWNQPKIINTYKIIDKRSIHKTHRCDLQI